MEEEVVVPHGLDESTISLICGVSVLFLVLAIVALGVIGFFIKVEWHQNSQKTL